jgi:RNA polymerase sigma-70 factor (ECF subfamily)
MSELSKLSDSEIVKLVRNSDKEIYKELVLRYQNKIFAYLYRFLNNNREEAEDLAQEVFIKAYRALQSFDTKRKFSSWLYRIAHNEAVNLIKRKGLISFFPLEKNNLKDITSKKSEEIQTLDIERALSQLKPEYREVLILRYFEDKSYEEISEILKKPINTVGVFIKRAKCELKKFPEIKSLL